MPLQLPNQGPINSSFDFYTPLTALGKQWNDNAATATRKDAMAQVSQQLQDSGKITDYSPFFKSGDPSLLSLGQKMMQSQQENATTAASAASLADYRKASLANEAARIGLTRQSQDEEQWQLIQPKPDEFGDTQPPYAYNKRTHETKPITLPGQPASSGDINDVYGGGGGRPAPAPGPSPFPSVGKQASLALPPTLANANASMDVPPPQQAAPVASSPSMLSSLASMVAPTEANAAGVGQAGQPSPQDTSPAAVAAQTGAAVPSSMAGWANPQALATEPQDFQAKATDPIPPPKPGEHTIADFKNAVRSGVSGDDLYNYLPLMVKNRVRDMVEGRMSASGIKNAQVQALLNIATTIDPGFSDNVWKARSTMWNDLAKSTPGSAGGIISNGASAMDHLAKASDQLVDLGNFNGYNGLGGGAFGYLENAAANNPFTRSNITQAKIGGIKNTLGRYGAESTKFYAGTAGTGEERKHANEAVTPETTTGLDQAAYLESEAELMERRFKNKEDQVRGVMGDDYLQKHPIPGLVTAQQNLAKVRANIELLRGNAPAEGTTKTKVPWSFQ